MPWDDNYLECWDIEIRWNEQGGDYTDEVKEIEEDHVVYASVDCGKEIHISKYDGVEQLFVNFHIYQNHLDYY